MWSVFKRRWCPKNRLRSTYYYYIITTLLNPKWYSNCKYYSLQWPKICDLNHTIVSVCAASAFLCTRKTIRQTCVHCASSAKRVMSNESCSRFFTQRYMKSTVQVHIKLMYGYDIIICSDCGKSKSMCVSSNKMFRYSKKNNTIYETRTIISLLVYYNIIPALVYCSGRPCSQEYK